MIIEVTWSITETAKNLCTAGAAKIHANDAGRDSRTLCGIDTGWNTAGAIWEGDARMTGDGKAWVNCKRCLKIMGNSMTATRTPKEQKK